MMITVRHRDGVDRTSRQDLVYGPGRDRVSFVRRHVRRVHEFVSVPWNIISAPMMTQRVERSAHEHYHSWRRRLDVLFISPYIKPAQKFHP